MSDGQKQLEQERLEDLIGTQSEAVGEMVAGDGWTVVSEALRKRMASLRKFTSKRSHTEHLEKLRFLQGQIDAFEEVLDFPNKLIKRLTS